MEKERKCGATERCSHAAVFFFLVSYLNRLVELQPSILDSTGRIPERRCMHDGGTRLGVPLAPLKVFDTHPASELLGRARIGMRCAREADDKAWSVLVRKRCEARTVIQ